MPKPRLLIVAHGTASAVGSATTQRLLAAVRGARPNTSVDVSFLDVGTPRLPDALDERPTVVLPLLLSTGYHVQSDIPAATAAYPNTRVARHLGPHPLLVDALIDRLGRLAPDVSVALVGAGSSRAEASDELAETGRLLAARLSRPVPVLTLAEDVRTALAALPAPARVATYLLAEGRFLSALHDAAAGVASVADPIAAHPALVRLAWERYDAAAGQ